MTYRIEFPIGDWSGDGHEKCDYYVVESNKPIEEVREVHFKCPDVLGFEIGNICAELEEQRVSDEICRILNANKIDIPVICYDYMTSESLAQLWINILNHIDPELELRIIPKENYPSITFYGYDEKKRHLDNPGYGVFYF